jgi:hypothetical protein
LPQEIIELSMLEVDSIFGSQEEETQVSIIFTCFFLLLLKVKPLEEQDEGKIESNYYND